MTCVNSLGEHGQDVSYGLHGHGRSLAALHGPDPPPVQEVARQRGQRGGGCPAGRHAEGQGAVGGQQEVLHAEDEGGPEVQRQLVVPAKHQRFTLWKHAHRWRSG